jgi:hypothetical protein
MHSIEVAFFPKEGTPHLEIQSNGDCPRYISTSIQRLVWWWATRPSSLSEVHNQTPDKSDKQAASPLTAHMCSYTPAESGMPLKGAMHAIFFFNALSEVLPALPKRCTHRAMASRPRLTQMGRSHGATIWPFGPLRTPRSREAGR